MNSSTSLVSREVRTPSPTDKRNDDAPQSPPAETTSTTCQPVHMGRRHFATITLIAISLTTATTEFTFSKWRQKLHKMGNHQTRGGINDIPRDFTNGRGDNFRIPRGVPLPPPLFSALCATIQVEEECSNFKAYCSWCPLGSCVPSDFLSTMCKHENKQILSSYKT